MTHSATTVAASPTWPCATTAWRLQDLSKATEINQEDGGRIALAAGRAYLDKEGFNDAIADVGRAIEINPGDADH